MGSCPRGSPYIYTPEKYPVTPKGPYIRTPLREVRDHTKGPCNYNTDLGWNPSINYNSSCFLGVTVPKNEKFTMKSLRLPLGKPFSRHVAIVDSQPRLGRQKPGDVAWRK